MAGITGVLITRVASKLSSSTDGVNVRIGAIEAADQSLGTMAIRSISTMNAGVDLTEKAGHGHYPSVLVYCDKLGNTLEEKFRRFSGKAHLVIEVRTSQDRLEGLDASTQLYVDAVCALLDDSRGDWGGGSFYGGGYTVTYDPVTRGGKNFLQRAKVGFDVEVSK